MFWDVWPESEKQKSSCKNLIENNCSRIKDPPQTKKNKTI